MGGGIYNSAGNIFVIDSDISGNYAIQGGGVLNDGGSINLDFSTIFNNFANQGGAVYNKSILALSSSIIQNNIAGENGGGILNSYDATLTLTGSTVTLNTADYGGGIYNDGSAAINSSLISNNTGLIYGNNLIDGADIPLVYLPVTSPDDPLYNELWGVKQISAPSVWSKYTGSDSITVAVIDSGVDYLHPDLVDNMWHNPGEIPDNGIDDDHNGYVDDYWGWNFVDNNKDPMDDMGHGTHCAGTIGAVGNNDIGVAGVNWNISIMALKVGDNEGLYTDAIVNAIYYAVNMGAKILSCSFVGDIFTEQEYQAFEYAYSKEGLIVAAAGNDTNNNDIIPIYPASYDLPNIISVAATGNYQSLDNLASFSNYGAVTVDLGAPGANILSTVPLSIVGTGYAYYDGTSMSTPMVSGAAALIWSKFPQLTNLQIKSVLMDGVDRVYDLTGKTVTGGRLNLAASYQLAYNLFWRIYGTGFNDATEISIVTDSESIMSYNSSDYLDANFGVTPWIIISSISIAGASYHQTGLPGINVLGSCTSDWAFSLYDGVNVQDVLEADTPEDYDEDEFLQEFEPDKQLDVVYSPDDAHDFLAEIAAGKNLGLPVPAYPQIHPLFKTQTDIFLEEICGESIFA